MDMQGGLKKRTQINKLKLAERMFKLGFIAPFFIWEHKGDYFNLDGHGRSEVLCEIRKAGVPIPGIFPVAYIHAKDEAEAKEMILSISSQYGEWNEDELDDWLKNLDTDITDSLRLLNKEIKTSIDLDIDKKIEKEDKDSDLICCPSCGYQWELKNIKEIKNACTAK